MSSPFLIRSRIALAVLSAATVFSSHAASPLTLADAQRLAAADAPQVNAQQSALLAAQQGAIGAGELADPKLIAAIENVPTDGADRFNLTREFMTMRKIGLMQDFPGGDKRKLRGERADAEVRREAALLAVARLNLRRDVSLAWIERHFAERQLATLKDLLRESELQVATAQAALAGGRGQSADPLAARLAVAQFADRITDAERGVARAQAGLARWIGAAARQPLAAPPAFDQLSHRNDQLTGNLDDHPHLAMYAPLQNMATSEVRLAEAARNPDWSLEVAFAQRGPSYSNMLSIGVRIDLPIFQSRRQDPAIAAKLAMVEQVRAQTEEARRAHAAEIEIMLVDWNSARTRIQRYETELMPLARERSSVTLAAYRGGKAELPMVLEARRAEIETRLSQLQAEAELARAWASLNSLLPDTKEPS